MTGAVPFGDRRRISVGVLGGSFNPAHDGHVHISLEALKHLNLKQIWWLVSPQNPLKPTEGMAPLTQRLSQAKSIARDPRIIVTDIEAGLGTVRTADTLALLAMRYPAIKFVWLMGADNLAQMPQWWRWPHIFHAVRVAILDRSPYSYHALAGKAARRFKSARRTRPQRLAQAGAPAWTYLAIRRHGASGTAIRKSGAA